jgi:hypothetical protein
LGLVFIFEGAVKRTPLGLAPALLYKVENVRQGQTLQLSLPEWEGRRKKKFYYSGKGKVSLFRVQPESGLFSVLSQIYFLQFICCLMITKSGHQSRKEIWSKFSHFLYKLGRFVAPGKKCTIVKRCSLHLVPKSLAYDKNSMNIKPFLSIVSLRFKKTPINKISLGLCHKTFYILDSFLVLIS